MCISKPTNFRNHKACLSNIAAIVFLLLVSLMSAAQAAAPMEQPETSQHSLVHWYKGNLHTHSLWSDGDDYPEMVAEWYKTNGYHFLALSDHNILQQGQKWIDINDNRGRKEAFNKYLSRFGEQWVEQRVVDCNSQVRLKPLNEFRCLFEEPGRFLLIEAEEITGKGKIHVNAVNLSRPIQPQAGSSTAEVLQNDINAVIAQRQETGRAMSAFINHPNWHWMITAEDIMQLKDAKFFEIYNGHPGVRNYGDPCHAGTERMWDIILTKRLTELHLPVMYGIATDDAHRYHIFDPNKANPGRGWVVVKTTHLSPESVIKAMEDGDFYASTGVVLKDINFDGKTVKIVIEPEKGVSYTTQFIGTLKGYDPAGRPVTDANGIEIHTTRIYSSDIGKVLAQTQGNTAGYTLSGNEIYIRAKVISTKQKLNPFAAGDVEVAWIQPVVPQNN